MKRDPNCLRTREPVADFAPDLKSGANPPIKLTPRDSATFAMALEDAEPNEALRRAVQRRTLKP